jgi:septum formation protein
VTRLVLASASPARLATLRAAGIEPVVAVSDVDEPGALAAAAASAGTALAPADAVLVLARAKAEDVAGRSFDFDNDDEHDDANDEHDDGGAAARGALVLGCDSMLELDGEVFGKPADATDAARRWRAMRGRSGVLHTGHWLIDTRRGGATAGATASTTVHFADVSDAEVDAYVATGEPLRVAGAFTIDGLGGPFVERIEGDHHTVVGLSLPLLRHLLAELGVAVTDLWAAR